MSVAIWMPCGGKSNLSSIETAVWRIVEDQHRSSTMKLVDDARDQTILEDIIDRGKPPFPFPPFDQQLHYLLWTPFRYPPLKNGSRFGTRTETSLWYGSRDYHTSFAEKAYYRLAFRQGLSQPFPDAIENRYTAFAAEINSTNFVNLNAPSFKHYQPLLQSPTNYIATQQLGKDMRGDGVHSFQYISARDPKKGLNVGLFHPMVFAKPHPQQEKLWHSYEIDDRIQFYRSAPHEQENISFNSQQFLVNGVLPIPAI